MSNPQQLNSKCKYRFLQHNLLCSFKHLQNQRKHLRKKERYLSNGSSTEVWLRLCGLIGKPLEEFKPQFQTSFPKDNLAKALGAHCTIVEGKVVFLGG